MGVGLTALPTNLNFGKQPANTMSNPQRATLTNTASDSIFIDSVQEGGANPAMFSPNSAPRACVAGPAGLSSGSSCQISYEFAPTSAGSFQAEVEIQYHIQGAVGTGADNPAFGNGGPPVPIASVAPVTLNFGTVSVGATAQTQGVTLTNTGSAALDVTSISITGTNTADFSLVASGNTPCPTSSGSVPTGGVMHDGRKFRAEDARNEIGNSELRRQCCRDSANGGAERCSPNNGDSNRADEPRLQRARASGRRARRSRSPSQMPGRARLPSMASRFPDRIRAISPRRIIARRVWGPSATCTVNVAFQPTATGDRASASISVADDAPNSPANRRSSPARARKPQSTLHAIEHRLWR